MSRNGHGRARCDGCGLHLKLCLCASLPRLETHTRVVIVMHHRETRRPTNTGRLALACLPNSGLVIQPPPDLPLAAPLWPSGYAPAVLFPAADAIPLAEWRARARGPLALIALDGSWGQASRMRRRVPGLAGLASVSLPAGPPSGYRLRTVDRASRLSTLEAIARALGVLEGAAVQTALEQVFATMVDRALWMRGELDRAQVRGGIPADVERHFS